MRLNVLPLVLCLSLHAQAASVDQYLNQLKSPNPDIRAQAAKSLAASHSTRVVPTLITALNDPNIQVRKSAAAALGELRDPRAVAPLIASLRVESPCGYSEGTTTQIVEALSQIGLPAVRPLVATFGEATQDNAIGIARFAVKALAGILDPRLTLLLLEATRSSNAETRQNAIQVLGLVKDATAVPDLISILEYSPTTDSDVAVAPPAYAARVQSDPGIASRAYALEALGAINEAHPTPAAIEAIRRAQNSTIKPIRDDAARYLANHPASFAEIAPDLASADTTIRLKAVQSLYLLRDPQSIPDLKSALQSPDEPTRVAAVAALEQLLTPRHDWVGLVKTPFPPTSHPEALPPLLQTAREDPDPRVRIAALRVVAPFPDPRVLPAILDTLSSDVPRLRHEAIRTLGRITYAESVQQAIAALDEARKDQSRALRDSAYASLVELHSAIALPHLINALHNTNSDVRWHAADSLAELKDTSAIDPLVEALRTERESDVRQHIIRALITFNDPRGIAPIVELLRHTNDHDDLFWTPRNLGGSKSPAAIAGLVELLSDPSPRVRKVAAEGLAEIQGQGRQAPPSAVPALVGALNDLDIEVRREAARALINTTDRSTVPAFLAALNSGDWELSFMAAHALVHTGDPRAIPAIIATFETEPPDQTNSGAAALAESSDPAAIPAVATALSSPNPNVRLIAAQVLRYTNDRRSYPALVKALNDPDPAVRQAAQLALSGCSKPAPMD